MGESSVRCTTVGLLLILPLQVPPYAGDALGEDSSDEEEVAAATETEGTLVLQPSVTASRGGAASSSGYGVDQLLLVDDGGGASRMTGGGGGHLAAELGAGAETATAAEDVLQGELHAKQGEADGYILTAARLIAPWVLAGGWERGYEWCREQLVAAAYSSLAGEVQLARAAEHLRRRQYGEAMGLLRELERCDSKQRARAALNLSALHLLEGQLEAAGAYADYCCTCSPAAPGGSSPAAAAAMAAAPLVSRGNVHLAGGEPELALQV